mmetsp:Transcript_7346/g.15316  ORF Transcript_7346/g.15316 Transcript_7346/m.15316 type:complete len:279 (-) Transcript_7346:1215-2051(-)
MPAQPCRDDVPRDRHREDADPRASADLVPRRDRAADARHPHVGGLDGLHAIRGLQRHPFHAQRLPRPGHAHEAAGLGCARTRVRVRGDSRLVAAAGRHFRARGAPWRDPHRCEGVGPLQLLFAPLQGHHAARADVPRPDAKAHQHPEQAHRGAEERLRHASLEYQSEEGAGGCGGYGSKNEQHGSQRSEDGACCPRGRGNAGRFLPAHMGQGRRRGQGLRFRVGVPQIFVHAPRAAGRGRGRGGGARWDAQLDAEEWRERDLQHPGRRCGRGEAAGGR